MSWARIIEIIVEESGTDVAARIEKRVEHELRGMRLTVGAKGALTREDVDAVAPGRPQEAAKKLGVHPATVYRALRRRAAEVR